MGQMAGRKSQVSRKAVRMGWMAGMKTRVWKRAGVMRVILTRQWMGMRLVKTRASRRALTDLRVSWMETRQVKTRAGRLPMNCWVVH